MIDCRPWLSRVLAAAGGVPAAELIDWLGVNKVATGAALSAPRCRAQLVAAVRLGPGRAPGGHLTASQLEGTRSGGDLLRPARNRSLPARAEGPPTSPQNGGQMIDKAAPRSAPSRAGNRLQLEGGRPIPNGWLHPNLLAGFNLLARAKYKSQSERSLLLVRVETRALEMQIFRPLNRWRRRS